jgi:hypothetical protein
LDSEERGMVTKGVEAPHNLYSPPNGRHGGETRNAYKKHFRRRVVIGKIIL